MIDYNEAIDLLRYPATWCKGAYMLVSIGDRNALIPLMRAYEIPSEVSKGCLLDAMESLNVKLGVRELYERNEADERRLAVHLTELFPDEEYLPLLERAISDADPKVRSQARRALACQIQTSLWEAQMIRLLSSEDEETRAQAIQSLSRRNTDTARDALRVHAAPETGREDEDKSKPTQ